MNESKSQPYFSADFGEHGGRIDWLSHEDVINWIVSLREQWAWVAQQNPAQVTGQKIQSSLKPVIGALNQAKSHQDQGQTQQAEAQLAEARSTLVRIVRSNPWLLPKSAQRIFVEGIRDGGQPLEAALIVAHWMAQDFGGAPIRQVVNALLIWELYERGLKDRMKTESAALKRLASDMQSTLTTFQESERTQTGRFDELHDQYSEQTTAQRLAFDGSQNQRDIQWQKQFEEIQGELNGLKDTYDHHMALAAPVEYWDTKRKRHKTLSVVSFVAVIVCMIAMGWFLHTELQAVAIKALEAKAATAVTTPSQTATQGSIQATLQPAAVWHLGSFLLLATLSFWFIRLLVRIFLSNLHLENDASERVTMAKTYLALLRDGSLPKGDGISTVLAALFRPTGDGIVKDEGLPPTAMEWVTKLGGK